MAPVVKRYTKNPVGAHYGLGDWLLQRLTAVVMVAFTIGFIACLLWHKPASYADWKAIFSGTVVRLSTMFASVIRDSRNDVLDPDRGILTIVDSELAPRALASPAASSRASPYASPPPYDPPWASNLATSPASL